MWHCCLYWCSLALDSTLRTGSASDGVMSLRIMCCRRAVNDAIHSWSLSSSDSSSTTPSNNQRRVAAVYHSHQQSSWCWRERTSHTLWYRGWPSFYGFSVRVEQLQLLLLFLLIPQPAGGQALQWSMGSNWFRNESQYDESHIAQVDSEIFTCEYEKSYLDKSSVRELSAIVCM